MVNVSGQNNTHVQKHLENFKPVYLKTLTRNQRIFYTLRLPGGGGSRYPPLTGFPDFSKTVHFFATPFCDIVLGHM